jgi:transcription elongation factor Elf1
MDKFKGKNSCGCSASSNMEKASSVITVTCKKCGRTFRTNRKQIFASSVNLKTNETNKNE